MPLLHGGVGGNDPAVGRRVVHRIADRWPKHAVVRVLYQWRWSLVALWFAALILLILVQFWDYWSTLI